MSRVTNSALRPESAGADLYASTVPGTTREGCHIDSDHRLSLRRCSIEAFERARPASYAAVTPSVAATTSALIDKETFVIAARFPQNAKRGTPKNDANDCPAASCQGHTRLSKTAPRASARIQLRGSRWGGIDAAIVPPGPFEKMGCRRAKQRKLAAEGLIYKELVELMRRELAIAYMKQRHLPFSEIALLLGYSELSAFSRAVHRWTGQSPRAHRGPPPHP